MQLPLAEQVKQLSMLLEQDHDFGLVAAELGEFDLEPSLISTLHHQVAASVSTLLVTFVSRFRLSVPAALGLPTPPSADACPVFSGSRVSVHPSALAVSPAGQLQAVRLYRLPAMLSLGDLAWQFEHAVALASFLPDNLHEQTPKVIFQCAFRLSSTLIILSNHQSLYVVAWFFLRATVNGFSLPTLLRAAEKEQVGQKVFGDSFPSLLLVADTQNNLFGAFLTHPLRMQVS